MSIKPDKRELPSARDRIPADVARELLALTYQTGDSIAVYARHPTNGGIVQLPVEMDLLYSRQEKEYRIVVQPPLDWLLTHCKETKEQKKEGDSSGKMDA